MPIVAVMNRKGGSGKSTLSTQIAAWYASRGCGIILRDSDRQRSVSRWLGRRSPAATAIAQWPNETSKTHRSPLGALNVVIDTPGGIQGLELAKQLARADGVVVPVGPSVFDVETSIDFLEEIRQHPRVASGRCRVVVVGMRWPMDVLLAWNSHSAPRPISLLTVIAESSAYRECMESGGSVFDASSSLVHSGDLLQWQPLLDWLEALPQTSCVLGVREPGSATSLGVPRLTDRLLTTTPPLPLRRLLGSNKQLRSPESFVETMPPEGINAEELQALQLQARKQFALDMGQASTTRRTGGSALQGQVQRPPESKALRTTTHVATKSEPGWLTRLFKAS